MNNMNNSTAIFQYPLFYQLPLSLKILYSMVLIVLGIGYLFAMVQVYEVHSGRDGEPGLSVADIRIAYNGNPGASKLEAALKGPMNSMVSPEDKVKIISWVRSGSSQKQYDATIQPILSDNCYGCHDGSNPHMPNLTIYDNVKKLAAIDTGASVVSLVRVSHIHLFGLTFIFTILGIIFSHSYVKKPVLKCVVIAAPFVAIIMDIASWWLTKVSTPFAYVVMIGGALMALSFAYQWVVSMYQLWFFICPDGDVCQEIPGSEEVSEKTGVAAMSAPLVTAKSVVE